MDVLVVAWAPCRAHMAEAMGAEAASVAAAAHRAERARRAAADWTG